MKKQFNCSKSNQDIINKFILEYKAKKSDASKHTIRNIEQILRKLANFIENNTKHKSLKDATKDELVDFFNNNAYVPDGSHNITGSRLIPFYRFIYDLDKHSRPPNMRWYEATSKRTKKRLKDPDRIKNLLITPEEYKEMLEYSNDFYGQNKAMWETYYLSGFRPEELQSMKIKDVVEDKKTNIVTVNCNESKTDPRPIQLTEYPENLMRYVGNHPSRHNKEAPLWFALKGTTKLEKISMQQIRERFRKMRKNTKIKSTLEIKSFRKTRFTIMSNLRSKDNGLIYTDKQLAQYFGWELASVPLRRDEYDLATKKEMEKIILTKPIISKSYDTIVKEKNRIEDHYKPKLEKQDKELKELKKINKEIKEILKDNRNEFLEKIESFRKDIQDSLICQLFYPQMIRIRIKGKKEKFEPRKFKISDNETITDVEIIKRMKELCYKYIGNSKQEKEFIDKYFSIE